MFWEGIECAISWISIRKKTGSLSTNWVWRKREEEERKGAKRKKRVYLCDCGRQWREFWETFAAFAARVDQQVSHEKKKTRQLAEVLNYWRSTPQEVPDLCLRNFQRLMERSSAHMALQERARSSPWFERLRSATSSSLFSLNISHFFPFSILSSLPPFSLSLSLHLASNFLSWVHACMSYRYSLHLCVCVSYLCFVVKNFFR